MATDIRQLLPTTVRAALLAGSAPSALNPYITASALSSFGFVPYTGATASLDMGANNIVTGGAPSLNQRELRAGLPTAFVDIGSFPGAPTFAAVYMNQTTPAASNFTLASDGSTNLFINAPTVSSTLYLTKGNGSYFQLHTGDTISGATPSSEFRTSKRNNITAGNNYTGFFFHHFDTNQWATGNVPNVYNTLFSSATITAVGASTFTNVYGVYVNAPTAGTNATITNNYAAGFSGRVGQYGLGNSTYFGDLCGVKDDLTSRQNTAFGFSAANKVASGSLNVAIGATALFSNISGNNNVAIGGLTLYQATSNSNIAVGGYALFNLTSGQNNVAIGYDTGGGVTVGANNIFIGNSITGLTSSLSNNIILATNAGAERFRYNPSQGSPSLFSFSAANTTGNVASTEINIFRVNAATTTLSTGALTTQRFFYLPSQTLAFAGASTVTNAYGLFVEAPTAGTNATITNNWAAGFAGNIIAERSANSFSGLYTSNTNSGSGAVSGVSFISNGVTQGQSFIGATSSTSTYIGASLSAWYSQKEIRMFTDANVPFSVYTSATSRFSISGAGRAEFNTGNIPSTAAVNAPIFKVTGNTNTFGTGPLSNQYFNHFSASTLAFNAASTATNVYTIFVEASIAGTNATITNNYALGISGGMEVASGNSLFRGVVTIARGIDANVTNFSVSSGTANTSVFSLNTDQPNSRVLLTARNSNTLNLGTQDLSRAFFDTAGNFNIGNASSTNQRLVRIGQDTAFLDIGSFVGSTANSAIYFNASNPGAFTTTIYGNSSSINVQGASGANIAVGGFNAISINSFLEQTYTNFARTSGAFTAFTWTKANSTGQTASTNIQGWLFTTGSRQWNTGAITTQQEILITSPTYSFTGASTITDAYSLFVNAPTAGTNATITNRYAAGFSGNVQIQGSLRMDTSGGDIFLISAASIWWGGALGIRIVGSNLELATSFAGVSIPDTRNIQFSTVTGSRIGTATNQKIGFWNATPIIQPTTAVASATFVANSGTAVNDASTFDGYTVGQVVKALRNTGLLA